MSKPRCLLVDLGGLDPDSRLVLGQLVLAKIQIELHRRETISPQERPPYFLFCDEFQTWAAAASTTWRELCSRGRRYGLNLVIANQWPSQVPPAVRDEILSNAANLVVFSLGSRDCQAVARELLYRPSEDEPLRPVPLEALVNQPVGHAVAKLGTGACAFKLHAAPPIAVPPIEAGAKVLETSWRTFGSVAVEPSIQTSRAASATPVAVKPQPRSGSKLSEAELRFLKAVFDLPGHASAEYAKTAGLNGTRAAQVRRKLIEKGLIREHKLARRPTGRAAVILEPLGPAREALAAAEGAKP